MPVKRETAIALIVSEAFAEDGLAMLAHEAKDPGFHRIQNVIESIEFLSQELSGELNLDRPLVAALFLLAGQVPEDFRRAYSPTSDSRCSLFQQIHDLQIAVTEMIENFERWPDESQLVAHRRPEAESFSDDERDVAFEGYRVGDLTYCTVPGTEICFPVRVIRLGFNVVEVNALFEEACRETCVTFLEDRLSRCFVSPDLPNIARFGGFDESLVNAARKSGPELRLLPTHYATTTMNLIRQRHGEDPENWPLPTGELYARWFQEKP